MASSTSYPSGSELATDCALVPCARCGQTSACIACDWCLGCRRAICMRCDTEPTPVFECNGDPRNVHPHNPEPWPEPEPAHWPEWTCAVTGPWRGIDGPHWWALR